MPRREETKRISAGVAAGTSDILRPASKAERRFTPETAPESELDKLG
jgi:hypothetical protein